MSHAAFETAGAEAGIEIWTIENFEPVPIDTKMYGKFYNGDSYIVLKTTGDSNSSLKHDAHFWLGSKTTQDKKGSAAIWTVTLDDMLGGRAVHHREVQGHESNLFLGYFKPAIRYMEGGNESGFTEVETNAGAEKRLLKLSGSENMRIEEVPAESSSLTSDYCFILEVDHDIFVLMPEGAKATQRRKIISVANTLRDDYHNGRATIEIIDEFSSDDDVALFFEALGSGSKEDLVSDDSSVTYAREDISAVYLYRCLLGEELDIVSLSKPYKQSQLSSDEIYILDTPCSGVFIWLGSQVEADVKKEYAKIATQYLDIKEYPSWVNITRVAEGAESSTFKQFFRDWETPSPMAMRSIVSDLDAGYFYGDAEESAQVAKLIGKSAAARGYMPDNGEGTFTVTRIAGDQEDITEKFSSGVSVLYQGDIYVVKYQCEDGACVIYLWIGSSSSAADQRAAVDLFAELDDELGDNLTIVKVPQGHEPMHFLSIFKGNLAIIFGSKDNEHKPENANGSYEEDKIRLFKVEGTKPGIDMRVLQVPEKSDNLEDDDVFVLETKDGVYVWNGKESTTEEHEAALSFVKMVVGDEMEVSSVDQGSEPDEFWGALGGIPENKEDSSGWKKKVNCRVTTPRTLTSVNVKLTGKIVFEDLDEEYSQQDLSDDGVFILDTGEELYVWQGKNVPDRFKTAKRDIVKEYIEDDDLERTVDSVLVFSVKQGAEPAIFKKLFSEWDDDMWDNQTSYEELKKETIAGNSK